MTNSQIDREVFIVTGGASAIGHAISTMLVSKGHNVVLTYKNNSNRAENLAKKLRDKFGSTTIALAYDLTSRNAPSNLTEQLKQNNLTARGLVHNAVVWPGRSDDSLQAIESVDANISGTLQLINEIAPVLAEKPGGRIVLISSNISTDGMAGSAVYGAAKASLFGACRSLAWELGPKKTTVNVVAPGLTQTERISAIPAHAVQDVVDHTPISRLVTPHEVASVTAFLCSANSSGVTGECIRVTGGH